MDEDIKAMLDELSRNVLDIGRLIAAKGSINSLKILNDGLYASQVALDIIIELYTLRTTEE